MLQRCCLWILRRSDLDQLDISRGQPLRDLGPVMRLPALPGPDGHDGHHDIREPVADYRLHETRHVTPGGPKLVEEVSDTFQISFCDHRELSSMRVDFAGGTERRPYESKRNADAMGADRRGAI